MTKTRLSFFYLATYLWGGGAGFLFAPALTLKLMLATGTYDEVFVRLAGGLMMGLGIIVVQIIRHRVETLYRTTLYVRVFFSALMTYFYVLTSDRLFLVILGVVLVGMCLTAAGFFADRRRVTQAPAH